MAERNSSFASNRLESFSDGVFAILITIMVLSIHTPSGHHFSDLTPLRPVLLSYLLSFIYLMIYWNNHHHLLKSVESPNGWVMWANSNLLFWLSLVPFSTAWLGTSGGSKAPAVIYGISLLLPATAYFLLQLSIVRTSDNGSALKEALGRDLKGKLSPVWYATAIGFAFFAPIISYAIYAAVAVMWIVPDRRISKKLNSI